MSKLKCFSLNYELIILYYHASKTEKIEIIEKAHGNTKKKDAPAYWPRAHSSRKDLEDTVLISPSVTPRHLLSHIKQSESPILEEADTNHNIQQIYNYG